MAKTILEIFEKYTPSERERAWLDAATQVSLRADKTLRMAEIRADFPALVDKKELYAVEGGIAAAYRLNSVRILPHYSAELFDKAYIPAVLLETERVGTVSKGFFGYADVRVGDGKIEIGIPFGMGGIGILDAAHTAARAGSISNELLCRMGARLPIVYRCE